MEFFSQDGQDKFIVGLLNNKKGGFFLDIGAYDGKVFSNTLYLEKELGWKGICIEPNPLVFKNLEVNRKCICINCCIGNSKGNYKFLAASGAASMLSGLLDMFDQNHLLRIDETINKHGGTKQVFDVAVVPLKGIVAEQKIKEIDYCNIDVEGGEMSVLNSIDFSKVSIKVFTIENNNGTGLVHDFLYPYGYKLIAKLGADEVYELNSTRYDLMLQWRIASFKKHLSLFIRSIKKNFFL